MAKATRRATSANGNGWTNSLGATHRIFDDVLALAGTLARGRKDYGAGKIQALADSARGFAESVNDIPHLRTHVDSAAESLEDLAAYVSETDIEQMVSDAGVFARRHPMATLAASVIAGVAVSRFLRPSSTATRSGLSGNARTRASAAPRKARGKKKTSSNRAAASG